MIEITDNVVADNNRADPGTTNLALEDGTQRRLLAQRRHFADAAVRCGGSAIAPRAMPRFRGAVVGLAVGTLWSKAGDQYVGDTLRRAIAARLRHHPRSVAGDRSIGRGRRHSDAAPPAGCIDRDDAGGFGRGTFDARDNIRSG